MGILKDLYEGIWNDRQASVQSALNNTTNFIWDTFDNATSAIINTWKVFDSWLDNAGTWTAYVGKTINQWIWSVAWWFDYLLWTKAQDLFNETNKVYDEYINDPNKRNLLESAVDYWETIWTKAGVGILEWISPILDYAKGEEFWTNFDNLNQWLQEREKKTSLGKTLLNDLQKYIWDYYTDQWEVYAYKYEKKIEDIKNNPDKYKNLLKFSTAEGVAKSAAYRHLIQENTESFLDRLFQLWTWMVEMGVMGTNFINQNITTPYQNYLDSKVRKLFWAEEKDYSSSYKDAEIIALDSNMQVDSWQEWWKENIRNSEQVLLDEFWKEIEDHSKIKDMLNWAWVFERDWNWKLRRIWADEIELWYWWIAADIFTMINPTNKLERLFNLKSSSKLLLDTMEQNVSKWWMKAIDSYLSKVNFSWDAFSKIHLASAIKSDILVSIPYAIADELNKKWDWSLEWFLGNVLIWAVIWWWISWAMSYAWKTLKWKSVFEFEAVKDDLKWYMKGNLNEKELFDRLLEKKISDPEFVINNSIQLKQELSDATKEIFIKKWITKDIESRVLKASWFENKADLDNELRDIFKNNTSEPTDSLVRMIGANIINNC